MSDSIKKPETPNETPKSEAAKDSSTPPSDGSNLDEFGYEKAPTTEGEKKAEDKKPEESTTGYDKKPEEVKKPEDDKIDPATGYDKKPEEVKPEDKKPEDKKPDEKSAPEDFDIKDKGPLNDEEIKDLKDFVKANKIPKEIANLLVEKKKAEVASIQKALEDHKAEQKVQEAKVRSEWYKELKDDPDFGLANFDQNLHQVEKVLKDFFPNMKKKLTESKAMLPPYVMRDLGKLAAHLYSSEKVVNGDPTPPPKDDKKEIDPLSFYNS